MIGCHSLNPLGGPSPEEDRQGERAAEDEHCVRRPSGSGLSDADAKSRTSLYDVRGGRSDFEPTADPGCARPSWVCTEPASGRRLATPSPTTGDPPLVPVVDDGAVNDVPVTPERAPDGSAVAPMLPLPRDERRYRPLVEVLVRRRRLRAGLVQGAAISLAVGLGLLIPQISVGPTIGAAAVAQLLIGLAASIVPFIGLVYSLLFLVTQFGSTNLTPRLNLFRDNPLVWRAFSYFLGLLVWAATAALASSSHDRVSLGVPVVGVLGVLVALGVFRRLQVAAFSSIQLAPTLRDIRDHGRAVIDALYTEPYEADLDDAERLSEPRAEIRWEAAGGILRQVDLPALVRAAVVIDGVIELRVAPGDTLREGGVVALVRGGHGDVDGAALLASLEIGLDRSFDQDPRFAFRLLADIAIRALSAAINDQATATQVIDSIDALLAALCNRRLNVGRIHAANGQLQVLIPVPDWPEYVELAIGDVARASVEISPVRQRLLRLLDDIEDSTPPARRSELDRWRVLIAAAGDTSVGLGA